jgi:hypothetical protein
VIGWLGYRPADFVPYGTDAWLALIEAAVSRSWPAAMVMPALGLAALLLLRARPRIGLALLAPAWIWVGGHFLATLYAELNWAGGRLGAVFVAQAVLLLSAAVLARPVDAGHGRPGPAQVVGFVVAAAGLAGWPLVTVLAGGPGRIELFGIHPDPTAAVTVGALMASLRGPALAALMVVPVAWCALTGVHLRVLGIGGWPAPLLVAAAGVIAVAWRARRDHRARSAR